GWWGMGGGDAGVGVHSHDGGAGCGLWRDGLGAFVRGWGYGGARTDVVSSGVGGKPTVQFAAVNVQIVSGSGATDGAVNGEGNLVIGYDENPAGRPQTGSHDLILGERNSWSGYAELLSGYNDTAKGKYAVTLGASNSASGAY